MNNEPANSKARPHFLIAGYGAEGIAVTGLLQLEAWLQAANGQTGRVDFFRLNQIPAEKHFDTHLADTDMVIIVGSDNDITPPPSALTLATQCRERNIPCLVFLTITAANRQPDGLTNSLCNLATHCLLSPFKQPVDNFIAIMQKLEAISTLLRPLLFPCMVGVDFDDISSILNRGRRLQIGIGGANKTLCATRSIQSALQQIKDISEVRSTIALLTFGEVFSTDDYAIAFEILDQSLADDCLIILLPVHDESQGKNVKCSLLAVTS